MSELRRNPVDACSLMLFFGFGARCSRCGRTHACDMGAWLSAYVSGSRLCCAAVSNTKSADETPVAAAARTLPRCRRLCAASTTAILLLPPSLPAAATTRMTPVTRRERGRRQRCVPMTMKYLVLKRNGHRSQETCLLGSWKDSHWGSWKDSHWHWGSRRDSHWHCSAWLSYHVVLGLSAWLSARGSQRWITLCGLSVWLSVLGSEIAT
jgi:hypothetical protein